MGVPREEPMTTPTTDQAPATVKTMDLVQTLNQIVRNYERQVAKLDVLLSVKNPKDGRYINADVELHYLDLKFNELIDCVKEDYGSDVQSLLLNAADQILSLKLGE